MNSRLPKIMLLGWICQQILGATFPDCARAQTAASSFKSFFPLKVGNAWITYVDIGPGLNFRQKHSVVDTVRFEGKLYFEVDFWETRYFREDSAGHFFEYRDTCETILMDYNLDSGDTLELASCRGDYAVLLSRDTVTTFIGETGTQLEYYFDYEVETIDEEQSIVVQEGVGPFIYHSFFDTPEYLRGAIIDGQVYGDTTLTAIRERASETPEYFHLDQNYPNPFRSSTIIRFSIGRRSGVNLGVYSLSGQELVLLFDGMLNAGSHQFHWDGKLASGRHAASGVYFLQLKAAQQTQRKKITVLR